MLWLVDGPTTGGALWAGSFNGTVNAAEANEENVLVTREPSVQQEAHAHFDQLWKIAGELPLATIQGYIAAREGSWQPKERECGTGEGTDEGATVEHDGQRQ